MDTNRKKPILGYLSAAPRVSTRPDAELGGARTHVLGVMQAFQALHWDVKPFIVGDRLSPVWSKKGSESIVRSGGIKALAADLMRLSMGAINARRAWRELGDQVDWVYERAASLQSLGGAFKCHNVPWILETNAPLFYEAKQERKTIVLSSLARRLEIRAYQECDVLVCVTQALKDIIISAANIPTEKIIVMPNGVDVNFFDPQRYQPARVFDGFTIGFVGGLYHWQRIDLLLEALGDLEKNGLRLHLVIVGDGAVRVDLEKKTRELRLVDQVKFVGQIPRDDVPAYTRGFDIGYSGQVPLSIGAMYLSPLKLYEYMAMAKSVIASDLSDAQRLVVEGKTGYLFQPGNKDSLKGKLIEAFENKTRLADMGRQARKEIVNHHSWTSRVSSLIEAVENILAQNKHL